MVLAGTVSTRQEYAPKIAHRLFTPIQKPDSANSNATLVPIDLPTTWPDRVSTTAPITRTQSQMPSLSRMRTTAPRLVSNSVRSSHRCMVSTLQMLVLRIVLLELLETTIQDCVWTSVSGMWLLTISKSSLGLTALQDFVPSNVQRDPLQIIKQSVACPTAVKVHSARTQPGDACTTAQSTQFHSPKDKPDNASSAVSLAFSATNWAEDVLMFAPSNHTFIIWTSWTSDAWKVILCLILDCTSTATTQYFSEDLSQSCVNDCTIGYFKSLSIRACVKCPSSCLVCFAELNCTSCKPGLFLHDGSCIESCPSFPIRYYANVLSSKCVKDCPSPYFGFNGTGKCELTCPEKYFSDITDNSCKLCNTGCRQCSTKLNCTSCLTGYVYVSQYNTCSKVCNITHIYYV